MHLNSEGERKRKRKRKRKKKKRKRKRKRKGVIASQGKKERMYLQSIGEDSYAIERDCL